MAEVAAARTQFLDSLDKFWSTVMKQFKDCDVQEIDFLEFQECLNWLIALPADEEDIKNIHHPINVYGVFRQDDDEDTDPHSPPGYATMIKLFVDIYDQITDDSPKWQLIALMQDVVPIDDNKNPINIHFLAMVNKYIELGNCLRSTVDG
jgi:hypothetical protein